MKEETLLEVIDWTFENGRFIEICQLSHGTEYYFWVRGLWDKIIFTSETHYKGAKMIDQTAEICWAIVSILGVFSRRKEFGMVEHYIAELQDRMHTIDFVKDTRTSANGYNVLGWYWITTGDFKKAHEYFLKGLEDIQDTSTPGRSLAEVYLAVFLYQQGRLEEARLLLRKALKHAQSINYIRNIIYIEACLAAVELDSGNIQTAEELLVTARAAANQHQDQGELISLIQQTYARIHAIRGEFPQAHAALTEAIDLFERMGMRRELAEAREELARLEAQMAEAAEL